ncbi:histidine phosphatase family protein [Actinoplanes sichuanensis]|uniref:Histidine phosphatase family protein n=1 Tax=Actinoplanes sichuanensis TaxID=512349 RepID=A0ABW4AT43_9ACTN|nr:histidine phosphatase family protein [Actinoplanes sichuanensis]BEL05030.1 histidine phosphatase family protein [Actinoplanes sichuanensis]
MNGLRLIAAGHTRALRRAVFGGDDALDEAGITATLALKDSATLLPRLFPDDQPWLTAPTRAAHQTATLLGAPTTREDPDLTGPDFGTWTGLPLDQIDPAGLQQFLTDPTATPHGGESLTTATSRLTGWLHRHTTSRRTAIADPLVIRLILTAALDLPPAYTNLAVAPLAVIRLTHHHRWTLHL